MPRKSKKEKPTQKKISQKAIQKVIINLDSAAAKRRRRARRPRGGGGGGSGGKGDTDAMLSAIVPPTVVYQTGYDTFRQPITATIPVSTKPTPSTVSTGVGTSLVPATFQDVGVGTEGFVDILDLPTKREQLQMLGDVVPPATKYTMKVKETPAKAPPAETLVLSFKEKPYLSITESLASVDPNFASSIKVTPTERILAIDTKRKELGLPPTPIVGYQEGTGKPLSQVQLQQEVMKAREKAKQPVYEPSAEVQTVFAPAVKAKAKTETKQKQPYIYEPSPEFQMVYSPVGKEPLMIFTPEPGMDPELMYESTRTEQHMPTKPIKRVYKKKSE